MTSGTSGVSNPTAALAPFPTRAAAFLPLKAGKPSWPHLPAPSRPSSRRFSGLVLQLSLTAPPARVTSGHLHPQVVGTGQEGHSLCVTGQAGSNLP